MSFCLKPIADKSVLTRRPRGRIWFGCLSKSFVNRSSKAQFRAGLLKFEHILSEYSDASRLLRSSFNSPIPVNRRNESATPVCVICTESWSDGGPMRNGLNASTVTSGLILSAQMVHQIMSVTLRVISNNRTIS